MNPNPIHYGLAALILSNPAVQTGYLLLGQTSGKVSAMKGVSAVVVDPVSQKVFVCDSDNSRVLRFSSTLPAITDPRLDSARHFAMTIGINQGGSYQIERSPDLKIWTNYGTALTPLPTSYQWTNPLVAGVQNFFRVREVAP